MKKLILSLMIGVPMILSAQKKFSIIPSGGYAWRVAEKPSGLSQAEKDYLNKLSQGFNFDVAAYYNLNTSIGLGLKFNLFSSSAQMNYTVNMPDGTSAVVMMDTKDQITFIGPSFIYSNFNSETKHKLYYDMALGMISYKSTTGNVVIEGSNLGLAASIAYQYAINSNIFVGPQLGYTAGTLKKMKLNGNTIELSEGQYEGLGRVSLSLAGTFRF
ncbi:hypothetical protein [Chryseobacterium lacus]|uniref:hypothetical protein n=1 Tax=Chryseobacterium lacus TaxID=2058346 RepID=UPI000F8634BB|nr:hypothetical protein [Chryseobacterium lacus]RST26070.1 hypothetical protein EIZ46_07870 [Chryseobacterium lacus]